jgi:hypothetical protein
MELQSYFGSLLNNLSFFKLLQCGWVGENENDNTFEQQLQTKPKSRKLSKKNLRKLNFSFVLHL